MESLKINNMIKGIYLKDPLCMETVSDADILSELDPLKKCGEVDSISCGSYSMARRGYYSNHFFIYTYTFDEVEGYNSMWKLLDTLQDAIPNFFKVFRWTKDILVISYQRPVDPSDSPKVEALVDELLRVTAWMLKEYHDPECASIKVRDYFELCVSYGE